jgi:hypothetical protein
MPERDHDDHEPVVLDPRDDPPISDTIAPQASQVAGQRLAPLAWTIERGDLAQSFAMRLASAGLSLAS